MTRDEALQRADVFLSSLEPDAEDEVCWIALSLLETASEDEVEDAMKMVEDEVKKANAAVRRKGAKRDAAILKRLGRYKKFK